MFIASVSVPLIAGIAIAVVFWFWCAFTAAAISRANGQSYNLWLLIGIVTGPIGLIIAYMTGRATGERHRRIRHGEGHKYDMPEMMQCPHCGQSVPSHFESCQFCRAPLHQKRRR